MRNKIDIKLVLATILISFSSCFKERICIDKKDAVIDSLFVPKETKFGEDVPIYINYEIDNGCGDFDGYTISGINRHLSLDVTIKYEGCQCPEIFQYGSRTISYSPLAPGEFYLSYLLKGTIEKTDTFYVK